MDNKYNWFYIDFKLETNIQHFITNVLASAVEMYKFQQLISTAFFVREWEKLHMVKVRIKSIGSKFVLEDFLNNKSSGVQFENYVSNNFCSVDFGEFYVGEYLTQFGRKSGFDGIADFFDESSVTTWLIFKEYFKKWDSSVAISFAIQKQLIFLKNSFMTYDETILFLENQVLNCLRFSIPNKETDLDNEEKARIIGYFNASYSRQQNQIHYLIKNLYLNTIPYQEEWILRWDKTVREKLGYFFNDELMAPCMINTFQISSSIPDSMLSKWLIFDKIMHLENNRIGINYRDEPFIYYLILKGLKNFKTL